MLVERSFIVDYKGPPKETDLKEIKRLVSLGQIRFGRHVRTHLGILESYFYVKENP